MAAMSSSARRTEYIREELIYGGSEYSESQMYSYMKKEYNVTYYTN